MKLGQTITVDGVRGVVASVWSRGGRRYAHVRMPDGRLRRVQISGPPRKEPRKRKCDRQRPASPELVARVYELAIANGLTEQQAREALA